LTLVGAEHDRQRSGLTGVGNALGNRLLPERHSIEKTQGADDLVEGRPGNPGRDEMNLESVNILELEPVRRPAEMAAELRHSMDV
jgi:hypothetical protein